MKDVYIIYLDENECLWDLEHQKLKDFFKMLDAVQISGHGLFITEGLVNRLKNEYNMVQADEQYRKELGTDYGDVIELLIGNARIIKGENNLYKLHKYGKMSGKEYFIDIPKNVAPIFLTHCDKSCYNGKFLEIDASNPNEEVVKIYDARFYPTLNEVLKSFNLGKLWHFSPKHGLNGRGNFPGESVLYCNGTRAQEQLEISLPCRTAMAGRSWQYDMNHDRYIKFYEEGDNPLHQWHAFHIEPDDIFIQVPNLIQKFFGHPKRR